MSSPTPRRYRWEIVYLTGPAELDVCYHLRMCGLGSSTRVRKCGSVDVMEDPVRMSLLWLENSSLNRIVSYSDYIRLVARWSCKVRVGSNGNLLWEASVLLGRKKGCIMDTLKFTAMPFGLANAPAVFMELMSREGVDDFVVYYDARSKDLKACLEKGRSEFDFEAKYHLGKANIDVVPWSKKKE
ncbi:hypothetical protein Tco_1029144 [Tanacetum coccineum]|uniref:Reverse transcriptase n=1 Tax=Tanacetum coccineum TaxID=301880 RepID=A0ABQ5G3V1_9ASTR